MKLKSSIIFLLLAGLYSSCENNGKKLPILGNKDISSNGKDTLYQTIPDFSFINQDSLIITPNTFTDKIYIADFFFTSCPTICPIMKNQMQRVYETFKENKNVAFLSHSIDPSHDKVPVLKDYAKDIGIDNNQWHFVTGNRKEIFDIAENHYMISAQEDPSAPGGAIHSGAFIFFDKQKRIRGYYDGTNTYKVDKLIEDIPILLHNE
ncbi:protein SCO1/2 [Flagellimonas taeanensis]|uniref:Protein SCO1/2 n=1 Tax=Flagellimonas taeanensis TaxID=1005926 RepID=A0A1M7B8E9_9FLAO|nr:SCO family protein [Allomuricauda taeanensis]SFC38532.1 protein SCO1/2 [Allomuricauda taeanensis]SHL51298.1 protein SCO1/2 [Allomuricauda taeanensis]